MEYPFLLLEKSMEEKKTVRKSIRLTDTQENFINGFLGESFNEKLDNMLSSFIATPQEIDSLYKKKMQLIKDIQALEAIKEDITTAYKAFNNMAAQFSAEQENSALNRIRDMIKEQGFTPTDKNVKLLHRLDQLTGKNNSMHDLVDANKNQSFLKNGKPEEQNIVKELCNEFKRQELMREQVIQQ